MLRDGDGKWYSIIRSIMVIGVNTALVKPADVPKKLNDLLDPKFTGKIGFASIDAGGTAYSMFFFMRQRFGLDYWKKLAAQQARIVPSAAPVVTDLARGETVIGSIRSRRSSRAPPPARRSRSSRRAKACRRSALAAASRRPRRTRTRRNSGWTWITSKRGSEAIGDTARMASARRGDAASGRRDVTAGKPHLQHSHRRLQRRARCLHQRVAPTLRKPLMAGEASEPIVLTAIEHNVCLLTINRPERRNAISDALTAALGEAVLDADRNPAVAVIAITGAGTSFCAGADLKEIRQTDTGSTVAYRSPLHRVERSLLSRSSSTRVSRRSRS